MGLMSISCLVALSFVINAAASRQRDLHAIGVCNKDQVQHQVATLNPAWIGTHHVNTTGSDGVQSINVGSPTASAIHAEVHETSEEAVITRCSYDPGSRSLDDCQGYALQTKLLDSENMRHKPEDTNETERLFRLLNCVWKNSKCVQKVDSIPLDELLPHLTDKGLDALVTENGKANVYYPYPYPGPLQWQHLAREEGYEKGTIAVQHRYIGDQNEREAVAIRNPKPQGDGDLGRGFYVAYQGSDAIMRPLIFDLSHALTRNKSGMARPTSVSTSIYALSVRGGERFLVVRDSFKANGASLLKTSGPTFFREHNILGFMKMRMVGVDDRDMTDDMNGLDSMEFNILDPEATLEFRSLEASRVVEDDLGLYVDMDDPYDEFEDPKKGGPLPAEWFW